MIPYECLRCGRTWELEEDQDPLGQCPSCRSPDYDKPAKATRICVVCEKEYPSRNNAHNVPGVCSPQCQERRRRRRDLKTGVFI